jgi:hypothetical protein
MLLALIPLTPVHAGDGTPSNMQAQGIQAVFDPSLEVTTITWTNIDSSDLGSLAGDASKIKDAIYNVYRHSEPVTSSNLATLTPFAQVDACSALDTFDCASENHPGHSASFAVEPGVNGSFYYAITTTLTDGTEAAELVFNGSQTYTPVVEVTQSVRTPFIISATFDTAASQTTLVWLNWNSISPDLPATGPDALTIRLWRTDYPINSRQMGAYLLAEEMFIATLNASQI